MIGLVLSRALVAEEFGSQARCRVVSGAGRDEQLRHLLRVHVLVDRRVRWGAERVEDKEHFVAFHQLARLFTVFGGLAIVIREEIDLATVDAAGII